MRWRRVTVDKREREHNQRHLGEFRDMTLSHVRRGGERETGEEPGAACKMAKV